MRMQETKQRNNSNKFPSATSTAFVPLWGYTRHFHHASTRLFIRLYLGIFLHTSRYNTTGDMR